MPRQYGFGIVGAGMIAHYHAEAIKQLGNAKLVAVCDSLAPSAQQFGQKFECLPLTSLDELVKREDIDVVTVATPSGTHAEIAMKCAEAGKHCIVEKPIDITLEKIDKAIAAHERGGTYMGGVFNYRFTETARIFKKAVDDGRFGKLTFGLAYGPWWRDQAYYDKGQWRGTWDMDGGGALMNQGIHTIDTLQWLMGPVKRVTAFTKCIAHERIEVEDTGAASVEFYNGALGTIACTTSMWPGHFRIVEVSGSDGTAAMADQKFFFWQFRNETEADNEIRKAHIEFPTVSIGAANPSAGLTAEGHRRNFGEFLQALDEKRRPAIDGYESRKAVQIILAVYESSRTGKTVELPPPPTPSR